MINQIIQGDCLEVLKTLDKESVDCVITSPPYWGLRDYGVEGQLGLEKTPEEYVSKMVEVFREVKRILKKEGTCWLNLGDSYANAGGISQPQPDASGGVSNKKLGTRGKQGSSASYGGFKRYSSIGNGIKHKDLVGIPWRVAFALQADGWYLRQDIIWAKPNPMPESVTDRCTKSHEYVFLLTKSPKYYFDNEAIKENTSANPDRRLRSSTFNKVQKIGHALSSAEYVETIGRNKRSVWTITTKPFKEAHFATFPEDLVKPMILAGCPEGGVVLDPFIGSGTTGLVARKLGRKYLGIELNQEYIKIAKKRLAQEVLF